MSDISGQLIKNSYNYVLQSDLVSGNVYRIGGAIPVDPKFLSGLTIFTSFRFADGSEQNGYVLTSDALGNASWQPMSGSTPVSGVTSVITSTGLSGSSTTGNITLINTAPDQLVTISGGTNIEVSGSYPNFTLQLTGLTDVYVTGGTYSNGTATFTNNTGGTFNVSGFYTGSTDVNTYTTAFTYNNNTFTIYDNTGSTFNATINDVTGLTVNGDLNVTGTTSSNILSATTLSGGTIYGDGTNLSGVVNSITTLTGLSADTTTGNVSIINTLPDQTVVLNDGTGISTTGTYPNFTITNSLPDQIVTISGGTGILTGGTYPNFEITNTAPDQIVTISGGTNISIGGSYPNFTISQTGSTSSEFTGGTVTGATEFTGGLSSNTFSATTISGGTFYGDGSGLTNIPIPTGVTTGSFGININNGAAEVTTGFKGYVKIPYSGTIIGWTMMGSVSGSTSIDIWKDTEINFPPTSADTITAGNYPNLTNQYINSDNILTGWVTNFNANDIFSFNVLSSSGVTNLNLTINVIKN